MKNKHPRLRNAALIASAAGTALAVLGTPLGAGPSNLEAVHPSSCDLSASGSYNFGGGITGTAKHCVGWVDPLSNRISGRTTINPDTDNSIGVHANSWDRCGSSESWQVIVDTGWYKAYSGSAQVETAHHTDLYQDCGQSQEHDYLWLGEHLITDKTPTTNEMRFTTILG